MCGIASLPETDLEPGVPARNYERDWPIGTLRLFTGSHEQPARQPRSFSCRLEWYRYARDRHFRHFVVWFRILHHAAGYSLARTKLHRQNEAHLLCCRSDRRVHRRRRLHAAELLIPASRFPRGLEISHDLVVGKLLCLFRPSALLLARGTFDIPVILCS